MNDKGANDDRLHFTPIDDHDVDIERIDVKLLIYSGDIPPEQVTANLGMAPTRTVTRGSLPAADHGAPAQEMTRRRPYNCWFLMSEREVLSKDIRRHIDWLVAQILPARDAFLALQQEPGVQMRLSCIIWTTGSGGTATLWPEHLRALADLNLECTFEFADYAKADE